MIGAIIAGLLIIALAGLFCLFGYRLFMFLLPVAGFIAGFLMGAQGMAYLLGEGFLATLAGWLAGLVLGLALAILSYFIYSFGVYLVATVFGLALFAGILTLLGVESGLILAVAAIAGAVAGIAAVAFLDIKKWLIVAITALGGAAGIIAGAFIVFGKWSLSDLQASDLLFDPMRELSVVWLLVWLVLGAASIIFQARTTQDFFIEGMGDDRSAWEQRLSGFSGSAEASTSEELDSQSSEPDAAAQAADGVDDGDSAS
jgi:hypothetical protein